MPIDREATLRQAEKLKGQGRLDLAIAEYVRLVEEQPRDWNSINALGDLYLRTGDVDRAVGQFVQIADHLFAEGFFPKAAALYKKALKSQPEHEHTLLRLAEIAAVQELLADARTYLRKLWELRSERGDDEGAADCLVRLATLPEADAETILTAARASKALGATQQAGELFRAAAEGLQKAGRDAAAIDALAQVMALDPSDVALRRQLVGRYVAAGQLENAGPLLDAETVGSDPDLLLTLAAMDLKRNDDSAARATLTRFITEAPDRSSDVLRLAGELGRAGEAERAFAVTEVVVDDSVLRSDWDRAVDVLQSFLVHGPHLPALAKLVQIASDAGLDDVVQETQERLAEAYLDGGQGPEAQTVAESLFARAPDSQVHAARLRRALELIGVDDPDEAIRDIRERLAADTILVVEPADVDVVIEAEETEALVIEIEPDPADLNPMPELGSTSDAPQSDERPNDPVEIDLSDLVASMGPVPLQARASPAGGSSPAPAADLEAVFEAMRPRGADYRTVGDAAELYERGQQRLESGQVREGLADLEEAARAPALRFSAAARLGREYVARGQANAGIEWLGRAAEMPAPSHDAGLAVLYELGLALDGIGEGARALAVLMEIEALEPNYHDVRQRLEALARAEEERRA